MKLLLLLLLTSTFFLAGAAVASTSVISISILGQPEIVFDHTVDQQELNNIPDGQVTAWKDMDRNVNLTIPHSENFRMKGPDLNHLKIDPTVIFSSVEKGQDPIEDHYNYRHWIMAPYTFDGKTIYAVTHSEWHACLLVGDCGASGNNMEYSWVATPTELVSHDGGASWALNGHDFKHVVAEVGYHWTGSQALSLQTYHSVDGHSGLFGPSRIVKEGDYYYFIAYLLHRDFSKVSTTMFQAPVDQYGLVLLRTKDLKHSDLWQAWSEGSKYSTVVGEKIRPFHWQFAGKEIHASQAQIIYDLRAREFLVFFTPWGANGAVYYISTPTLKNPVWSQVSVVSGTAQMVVDPRGPKNDKRNVGLGSMNYVSVIDPSSPGLNFEFTNGDLFLYYSTFPPTYGGNNMARDLYRIRLQVHYSP